MPIDPKAVVHSSAKIHKSAEICAYAVIGENVEIGAGTIVESHAVIQGPTKVGNNNPTARRMLQSGYSDRQTPERGFTFPRPSPEL